MAELVWAAIQEMESLARNCIFVEESYQRYMTQNCGVQKEEAAWREQGIREEAAARQVTKSVSAMHMAELWERIGLFNNEAAQRSNLFRLLLLEKRKLECDGLLVESRNRFALKSSSAGSTVASDKRRSRPPPDAAGIRGPVAFADFAQAIQKAKAEDIGLSSMAMSAILAHPQRTALVHNPYSFDGPSQVMMGGGSEAERADRGMLGQPLEAGAPPPASLGVVAPSARDSSSVSALPLPPPPSSASGSSGGGGGLPAPPPGPALSLGALLKKAAPEHWYQAQDASKASLLFPAQCAHLRPDYFAGANSSAQHLLASGCPSARAAGGKDIAASSAAPFKPQREVSPLDTEPFVGLEEQKRCGLDSSARPDGKRPSPALSTPSKASNPFPLVPSPVGPDPHRPLDGGTAPAPPGDQHGAEGPGPPPDGPRRSKKKGARAEDDLPEDHALLLTYPTCNHMKHWKRLRANRGFAYFVCYFCGVKWRMSSKGVRGQTLAAMAVHVPPSEADTPVPCG